ncbi:Glycine-rich RNA-binding protein blt801 [Camellia lanceoleosa]|uniref:Glycine-rich RNA-binding protein blt801 n=1 Tax=Camellia lanceoleosa TaxID=1840588 RepID=A0ACC0H5Q7_9ERIC|nr:Glycine-rich RNA-binding protein blt801 [Camellia lanceoleosa]
MADVEYKCFVGGLAWTTDDQSLERAFSQFGEVIESKIDSELLLIAEFDGGAMNDVGLSLRLVPKNLCLSHNKNDDVF